MLTDPRFTTEVEITIPFHDVDMMGVVWPVVDTRVKYRDAVTFEQRIRVRAHVEEYENRLRIAYQIFDAQTGKRTTTGYTIQVAVEEATREMCFVSPTILFERMGVTP